MKRSVLFLLIILAIFGTAFAQDECLIKGNINSKGEKIYHVPGSSAYASTKIDTDKGEMWFCTEEEAIAAGWHAPGEVGPTKTPKPTPTLKPTKTPKPTATPTPTATPLPYDVIGEHVYDMKSQYGVFTPQQADFLAEFSFRKNINDIYWDEDIFPLGDSVENFVKRLLKEGYLRRPTQEEAVEIIFGSYNMIKEELRSHNLSTDGTKSEMISRLLEFDPGITDSYSWLNDIYYATDKAKVIIDEFRADLKKAQSNAVIDTLDCLINKDYAGAIEIAMAYREGYAAPYDTFNAWSADWMLEKLNEIFTIDDYLTFYRWYDLSASRYAIALAYLFSSPTIYRIVEQEDIEKANKYIIAR